MADLSLVKPGRSALVLMHFQTDVFSVLFGGQTSDLVARANDLIAVWRKMHRPIVLANFALGPDYEAANPRNRLISPLKEMGLFREPTPVAGLNIAPEDKIYSCPRVNIFHDTSLHQDLQRLGVDSIVACGITTTGVLFSSVGWASDADYEIFLVKECCYDTDAIAHEALFRTSFATRAQII